jgi:hypothetical protein
MHIKRKKDVVDEALNNGTLTGKQIMKNFVSERFHDEYDFYYDSDDDPVFKDFTDEPYGALSYKKMRNEVNKKHPRLFDHEDYKLKRFSCCCAAIGCFWPNSHDLRLSELYQHGSGIVIYF